MTLGANVLFAIDCGWREKRIRSIFVFVICTLSYDVIFEYYPQDLVAYFVLILMVEEGRDGEAVWGWGRCECHKHDQTNRKSLT